MPGRWMALLVLLFGALISSAQSSDSSSYQISGGFSYLSNSINGVPGARQPLLGWEASLASKPAWRNLRFKIDYSGYLGNNLGAPQHPYFIAAGGQYDHRLGKENLFAEALFGDCGLNGNWGPNKSPGSSASFAMLLGGGVDTPVSRHLAMRFEGGYQYTNFALYKSVTYPQSAISYRVIRRTSPASPPGWSGLRIWKNTPPRRSGATASNANRSKANWCSRILEPSAIFISLPVPCEGRFSCRRPGI
jgi:hypothetical protein